MSRIVVPLTFQTFYCRTSTIFIYNTTMVCDNDIKIMAISLAVQQVKFELFKYEGCTNDTRMFYE